MKMKWKWFFFFSCFLFFFFFQIPFVFASTTSPSVTDNLRCWTQKACEQKVNGEAQGVWDNLSVAAKNECPGYGYCFPLRGDIPLAIAIPGTNGSVVAIKHLGDYIQAFYTFLLGFATLVTIVMGMVGGVQYILASGSPQKTSEATERIEKALIGLVLLFCAVFILFTVNPQLIALKLPTVPKVRQIIFISDETPCEDLLEKNKNEGAHYILDPVSGSCGSARAKITTDKDGNSIKGMTCRWTSCSTQAKDGAGFTKICAEVKGKDQCLSCMDIVADNELGITPSASICSALTPQEKQGVKKDSQYVSCEFSKDHGFSQLQVWDTTFGGQCAVVVVNCKQNMTCEDYDNQTVMNNDGTEDLDSFEGPAAIQDDFSIPERICSNNVCGNRVKNKPCYLDQTNIPVSLIGVSFVTKMVDCESK
jgi:hypothetical protein